MKFRDVIPMFGYIGLASISAIACVTHAFFTQGDINKALFVGLLLLLSYGLLQAINWAIHIPFDGTTNDALAQHWFAGGLHLALGLSLMLLDKDTPLVLALWTMIAVVALCQGVKRIGYAVSTILRAKKQKAEVAATQLEAARMKQEIDDSIAAKAREAREAKNQEEEDTQSLLNDLQSIFGDRMN